MSDLYPIVVPAPGATTSLAPAAAASPSDPGSLAPPAAPPSPSNPGSLIGPGTAPSPGVVAPLVAAAPAPPVPPDGVRYVAVDALSSNVFVAPTIISGPGALYFASPGQTAGQAALLYPQVPQPATNATTFHHGDTWGPPSLQVLSPGLYQVTLVLSNPVFATYESHQLWVTHTDAAVALLSSTFFAAIDPVLGYLFFASSAPEDYSTPQECVFTLNVPSGSTGSAWIGGSLPNSGDTLGISVTVKRLV